MKRVCYKPRIDIILRPIEQNRGQLLQNSKIITTFTYNFKTKPMEMIMDDNTTKLVAVQIFDNVVKAEIAKSILDSAGIFCLLEGEYMSTIYSPIAFPTRLMVREEDLAEAEAVLSNR